MSVYLTDQPFTAFQRSLCDHYSVIPDDPFGHGDHLLLFSEFQQESHLCLFQRNDLPSRTDQLCKTGHFFQSLIETVQISTDQEHIPREKDLCFFVPFPLVSFHLLTVWDKAPFQYFTLDKFFTLTPDLFFCAGPHLYHIPHNHSPATPHSPPRSRSPAALPRCRRTFSPPLTLSLKSVCSAILTAARHPNLISVMSLQRAGRGKATILLFEVFMLRLRLPAPDCCQYSDRRDPAYMSVRSPPRSL